VQPDSHKKYPEAKEVSGPNRADGRAGCAHQNRRHACRDAHDGKARSQVERRRFSPDPSRPRAQVRFEDTGVFREVSIFFRLQPSQSLEELIQELLIPPKNVLAI
jgi:hypothetical protein